MTIVVKAIVGGSNSGSILKEVIHRNSKMNREEIDRKMHWLGSYGGPDGVRSNWEAEVDMVNFAGMVWLCFLQNGERGGKAAQGSR